jgi:dynein heavy chain
LLIFLTITIKVGAYEKVYEDISKLDDVYLIDKWFRIDLKPFKSILLNIVKKWSYMFKNYLMNDVTDSLKELDDFIREKDNFLLVEIKEDDYDGLVCMVKNLNAVQEKMCIYDSLFDPMKKKIDLLKTYGQEVPDDVFDR